MKISRNPSRALAVLLALVLAGAGAPATTVGAAPRTAVATQQVAAPAEVDATRRFLAAAYQDFLERAPDAGGADYWAGRLNRGDLTRYQFVLVLATSPESVMSTVSGFYQDTLGRAPDGPGLAYWVDRIRSGRATVAQVAAFFYGSQEFFQGASGGTLDGWVTELYRALLDREPDAGGLDYWADRAQDEGRGPVALVFYQTDESARDRVAALYQQLLDRAPEGPGLAYWAGRIVVDGDLSLAAQLASSREYYFNATGEMGRFPAGTFAVGSLDQTLVDESRPTAAHGGQPAKPQRTLPTLVLYPAPGPADLSRAEPGAPARGGPWPVVVFSHGRGGNGPAYATTLRVWASAGYVVIAPTFPLSSSSTPGGPSSGDVREQAGDVSFLIDWVLDQNASATGPLVGLVDPDRIGAVGHSLGGFTSSTVGYNPCCDDPRLDAVSVWAGGYGSFQPDEPSPIPDGPPLLVVHGDADGTVPYPVGVSLFDRIGPPGYLVTLVGGGHIPPYVQGLNTPDSAVVTTTTLDFFDQFLKGDPRGTNRLAETVARAGSDAATLRTKTG